MKIKGLYQRENKIWYLRLPGNKRLSLDTTSKIEANIRAREKIDKFKFYKETGDEKYSPLNNKVRLKTAIEKYIKYSRAVGHSEATIGNHEKRLKMALEFFGDIPIQNIDEEIVYDFINFRRGKVNTYTSLRNDQVSLKALLNYCKKKLKIIRSHPYDYIPIKQVKTTPEYLNSKEIEELFRWKPKNSEQYWLKFFVSLAVITGFRRGELRLIKWEDIDYEKNEITVSGKTGKRVFPLSDAIQKLLYPYKAYLRRLYRENDFQIKNDMYVFHKYLLPYQPFSESTLTHCTKQVFRDCKFPEKYTLHSLRHTFGAHFYISGGTLEKLQELMGHSIISVTQMYAHITANKNDVDKNLRYTHKDSVFNEKINEAIKDIPNLLPYPRTK